MKIWCAAWILLRRKRTFDHLARCKCSAIDKDLEAVMETALQLVVLGRSARNAAKVKIDSR